MNNKADTSLVRNINDGIIYKYLLKNPNSTIPEISKATGFSLPTVTRTINTSIEIGLIEPTLIIGGEKGRKAQCYYFNKLFCNSLLIMIKWQRLIFKIIDVVGDVVEEDEIKINESNVIPTLKQLIGGKNREYSNIKTVCITLSGHIKNGIIYSSHAFPKLNGLNLKNYIEERLHVHVSVKNSIKILPYCGEAYIDNFKHETVLYLSFEDEDGCGAAISVNGQALSGANGAVGELYYIPIKRKRLTKAEIYIKFTQTMIATINPDSIVFYHDDTVNIKQIISKTFEEFPDYLIPKTYIGKGIIHDNFEAMQNIAFDFIKDSIQF